MIHEPIIMDLTSISFPFPDLSDAIDRSNYLETIETILQNETDLVILEGPAGFGKTTLLAQFAKRFPNTTISSFVTFASKSASDPDVLRQYIYKQIYWALNQEICEDGQPISVSAFNFELNKLSGFAVKNKKRFYFLIDGLDEFPKDEKDKIRDILSLLPFGLPNFKFLLTGDVSYLAEFLNIKKIKTKPFYVPKLSSAEAIEFLKNIVSSEGDVIELNRLCQGIPMHLASVRRSINSGISVNDLLSYVETPDFFDIEWTKVDKSNVLQNKILALVAHNEKRRTFEQIADILSVNSTAIETAISDLTFLEVEPREKEINFIHESFRKFAQKKLKNFEKEINDLLIENLLRSPESSDTLVELPGLYQKAGKLEDLLNFLSFEHFTKLLNKSKTLTHIKRQSDLGVEVAFHLKREKELLKLTMYSSVLEQFTDAETWRPEINARISIGDFNGAFAIAQSIIQTEERFHALAVIGRKNCELVGVVRPEVEKELIALYPELEPKLLGNKAVEIASDLIFSLHELAIDLIQKTANIDTADGAVINSLDWALARLTILAYKAGADNNNRDKGKIFEAAEQFRSKVHDPEVQTFITRASLLFKEDSADSVIRETEKIKNVGDKLFLLRQWIKNNRDNDDAFEVVKFALNLAISTTSYTFTATILRELALPLPFIKDNDVLENLIRIFDSQNSSAENLGPTQDFVRWQLLLARAEAKLDIDKAKSRIVDIYYNITDLSELDLKAVCLAWLLGALEEIDPTKELDSDFHGKIHSSSYQEFEECIELLLGSTASHFELTKPIIEALSKFLPDLAEKIALSLNTELRRNKALLALIESAVETTPSQVNLKFLYKIFTKFTLKEGSDSAVEEVIDYLENNFKNLGSHIVDSLPFINEIKNITSSVTRTLSACKAYKVIFSIDPVKYKGLAEDLLGLIDKSWKEIDQGWKKIDIGFEIVSILADVSQEKAHQYFEMTAQLRDSIKMDIASTAHSYILSLKVSIRAFKGLLYRKENTEQDFLRLEKFISLIPSKGNQVRLYSDIAILFYLNKNQQNCNNIVQQKIKPLLENIGDKEFRELIIVEVAPALYFAHQATAFQLFAGLPQNRMDEAIDNIVIVILTKQLLDEPFEEREKEVYKINYEEIVEICSLMEKVETDNTVFKIVKAITNTISGNKTLLSREQKGLISSELEKIVNTKLPNVKNITHDGYKIVSQSQIATIKQSNAQDWQDLISDANKLTNTADKAFTLTYIADNIPSSFSQLKNNTFADAKNITHQINAPFDRVNRFQIISECNIDRERGLAKLCLEEAFNVTFEKNDPVLLSRQRRIVDLAFRIDPIFANNLADYIDDDPAKNTMKNILRNRLSTLKVEKKMQLSESEQSVNLVDALNAPSAAWKNLGNLNSGQIINQHTEKLYSWLKSTQRMPISSAYSIFSWFIENAIRRFKDIRGQASKITPIFESTIQNVELAAVISSNSSQSMKETIQFLVGFKEDSDFVVEPNSRQEVLEYIKEWLSINLGNYLIIADPYFNEENLDLLQLVNELNTDCKVFILSSIKTNKENPRDLYKIKWSSMYYQSPPSTKIVLVGVEPTMLSPIHDRWLLTNNGGLNFGTSYNSLGIQKYSEISKLTKENSFNKEIVVRNYLFELEKLHNGKPITYLSFVLD